MNMGKHENYRVLLTFDFLSKNVKNAVLVYNSTRFRGIDKKLLNNCFMLKMLANILFAIGQQRRFKIIKFS